MSVIDTWTDETAERAVHLIRVAEAVVREIRKTYAPQGSRSNGIRPTTIDRWLTDAVAYLEEAEERRAATAAD